MEVIITRATFVMGKPTEAGDELDLEQRLAKYLISIGKAVAKEPEQDGGTGPLGTTSAEAIVEKPEAAKKQSVAKKK